MSIFDKDKLFIVIFNIFVFGIFGNFLVSVIFRDMEIYFILYLLVDK